MGKVGQISSISLTGVTGVQRSCKPRRRGEANRTCRQYRHTCARIFHSHTKYAFSDNMEDIRQKSNMSRRMLSGKSLIVVTLAPRHTATVRRVSPSSRPARTWKKRRYPDGIIPPMTRRDLRRTVPPPDLQRADQSWPTSLFFLRSQWSGYCGLGLL